MEVPRDEFGCRITHPLYHKRFMHGAGIVTEVNDEKGKKAGQGAISVVRRPNGNRVCLCFSSMPKWLRLIFHSGSRDEVGVVFTRYALAVIVGGLFNGKDSRRRIARKISTRK